MPKPAILAPPNRRTLWIALLIKKKPLTISSSQCHIPHIEIILVIVKFESQRRI
jgi:hypothetical protein